MKLAINPNSLILQNPPTAFVVQGVGVKETSMIERQPHNLDQNLNNRPPIPGDQNHFFFYF